ncbi:RHS repeat-associated core domain protein [[Clostridium] methylpentosum DSM 5476]|uniref:RHS repeat-associated core domain protein n=1 Tax=[Clostridium] methylpentosum DSM 5476 TaxID=537013 RepID=C0E8Y1_9FIRM|nr:RHS repeat-associated core domain protein [[Clostridium] methylpentosum DSM 5476]
MFGFSLNGVNYYYIRNNQNDIIGILDSNGNQVVSYVYDSWGKLVSTSGSLAETVGVQNPFRYHGYYYDVETGFYYLQSRYYDPVTGRFINSDSLIGSTGELNTHNMFAYCGNEPINRLDPYGFAWYYPFNRYSDTGLEMGPVYIKTSDLISSPSKVVVIFEKILFDHSSVSIFDTFVLVQ